MKIQISFQDSWENSFLDGSIDDFGKKREYIGSGKSGFENYKDISLTKNTVMGILYRLIGDQRKLSQIKLDSTSFFHSMESNVSFEERKKVTEEIIYLRNASGADDRSGFSGPKKTEPTELFSENFFDKIWSPLEYSVQELEQLILTGQETTKKVSVDSNRVEIGKVLGDLIDKNKTIHAGKVKIDPVTSVPVLAKLVTLGLLSQEDADKGLSYKILVYCSIYLLLGKISQQNPEFAKTNLTKNGTIPGLSKRSFTLKDFVGSIGEKKKVVGNPSKWEGYLRDEQGNNRKVQYFLKRKDGILEISIDVDNKEEKEIIERIESAGVGSFVVGKKGLAYLTDYYEEKS